MHACTHNLICMYACLYTQSYMYVCMYVCMYTHRRYTYYIDHAYSRLHVDCTHTCTHIHQ